MGLIAKVLEGQDVCIHAALLWGDAGTERDMRDTAAAARLFDAGRAGVARCVFMSSSAVHRPFSLAMREEDPLTTADYSGATKAAGEMFLRASCAVHQMTGVAGDPLQRQRQSSAQDLSWAYRPSTVRRFVGMAASPRW